MARPTKQGPPEPEVLGLVPGVTTGVVVTALATDVDRRRLALPVWLRKSLLLAGGPFVFILALELLKAGAQSYGNIILNDWLNVSNATNALGFGWLLAYLFLSGSPVAAIAISLFASQTISSVQTFTMITGSRLGASFIVLLVGFIYYLRGHQRAASIAIGVLVLLTTAAIYLPALGFGYWALTSGTAGTWQISTNVALASVFDPVFGPIIALAEGLLPGWALLLCGVATLLLAFSLLDRGLPGMHAERSAFRRIGQLVYRPAAMFILGAFITSVTLSVSVSLSILVPLSSKGLVRRENMVPYIMGANITTFIDTLVAALIVGGPAAFMIVFVEMVSVAALSLVILLSCYRSFERIVLRIQQRIIRTNRSLAAFMCIMFVIPIVLLLIK